MGVPIVAVIKPLMYFRSYLKSNAPCYTEGQR